MRGEQLSSFYLVQTDTYAKYKTKHLDVVTMSNWHKNLKFFLSIHVMDLVADWSQVAG